MNDYAQHVAPNAEETIKVPMGNSMVTHITFLRFWDPLLMPKYIFHSSVFFTVVALYPDLTQHKIRIV